MKRKKILSDRKDSNGNRFIGIINAFYIAKQCNQKPMFTWDAVSKAHLLVEDYKNFNKQRFISTALDTKENIFSKNFIQEHCLTYEDKSSLSLATDEKFRYLKKFKNYILNTNYDYYEITRTEDYIKDIWKDLDICNYTQSAAEIFNNINFTEKVASIIKQAHLKATELKNTNGGGALIAFHIRAGDTVYPFANFRKLALMNFHPTPIELAYEIIKDLAKDTKVIIFSDDINSVEELKRVLNSKNIFLAEEFRDYHQFSNTELFLFDTVLMSHAKKIYGTHSAVAKFAATIGGVELINPHTIYPANKIYQIYKENFGKLDLHDAHKAQTLFYTYLAARASGEEFEKLISLLEQALKYDYENDKYRIYILDTLICNNEFKRADEYLGQILQTRKEDFFSYLAIDNGNTCKELLLKYCLINTQKYQNLNQIAQKIKQMPFCKKFFKKTSRKLRLYLPQKHLWFKKYFKGYYNHRYL